MSAHLEVNGLSKSFGSVVVADGLSFSVAPGEALGIVGPNGAGKSTLLSMITGVLAPDAGEVVLDGHDLTRSSAASRTKRGVARSFQVPRPFTDMTVFENVYAGAAFGGGLRGQAGYDAARSALERTGLIHLSNELAGSLRLLDRKRLELARALATGPRLLLLDEIAGGLSDSELPPLIELIAALKAEGITIVWIEHIVHALTAVTDRLLCLAGGHVLADGPAEEVLAHPDVVEVYLGSTVEMEEAS
ncbi:ABC transporter ATP-binding protein [Nocardioides sp. GY 10127]|uniref:ABC transporter ATP-binding protein n=1 Tax=Nocardioides sp. GY 10127 TaxID=2569762 RepID=UPI0010A8221B|nr:ABC transporter ATP-binding protein [Nocardioides sp. GY 10127]TIC81772.1 ABC transporter ATP-binding protein [Nocardioides sp. GY 10127]